LQTAPELWILRRSIGKERRLFSITTLRRLKENAPNSESRARHKFHSEAMLINSFASADKRKAHDREKELFFLGKFRAEKIPR
jgi:hypothetical protein